MAILRPQESKNAITAIGGFDNDELYSSRSMQQRRQLADYGVDSAFTERKYHGLVPGGLPGATEVEYHSDGHWADR